MDWNWQVIFDHIPDLLSGAVLTTQLVVVSGIIGLFFGLILAQLRLSKNWFVQVLPFLYIFFFRGTPLLVQIFLIYYGLGQFEAVRSSFLWEPVLSQAYWCAIIAFTMNTSAYLAEIIRGAIQAIPVGELEAADAIGMSRWQKLTRIILPRAFGIVIPAYSNEVIFMLKGSALASTIALMDIMGETRTVIAKTYTSIEMFFAAGVVYLLLSWVILFSFRLFEKRMNRHASYVPPDVMTNTVPSSFIPK